MGAAVPDRYQFAAANSAKLISESAGKGTWDRPLTDASLFPAFCALKPAVGLALCAILERDGFASDDAVVLDGEPRRFTIVDALNHNIAIKNAPTIFFASFAIPPELRSEALAESLRVGEGEPAYTEWAGTKILETMCTQVCGMTVAELRSEIEAMWAADGLNSGLTLSLDRGPGGTETYWGIQKHRGPIPCLSLALEDFGSDELALNARCSAAGLVSWHRLAGKALTGHACNSLPSSRWLAEARLSDRPVRFDPGLARNTGYVAGLQQPMIGCGLDDLASLRTRWHPGWMGAVAAWHDPETEESVAIITPDIDFRDPPRTEAMRHSLATHVLRRLRAA